MQLKSPHRGFTLLEILISVAVVGILVAIAYPLYRNYQAKAIATRMPTTATLMRISRSVNPR